MAVDGLPERQRRQAPECFSDLGLDSFVAAITNGREEYDLAPFIYDPLNAVDAISYRQAVFRDLERASVSACFGRFAEAMRAMRTQLSERQKLHSARQQQRWFLDAAGSYRAGVEQLMRDLEKEVLESRALREFRCYLAGYLQTDAFQKLSADIDSLNEGLGGVHYCLEIQGCAVRVRSFADEPDYGSQVADAFARFQQHSVATHRFRLPAWPQLNPVESEILERVALLYADEFAALARFSKVHRDFVSPVLRRCDREMQFYLALLDHAQALRSAKLPMCYPRVISGSTAIRADRTFDIALATQLAAQPPANPPVVCNDIRLIGPERIAVITGPNQGGKTTFARTFGQLHYLARLGCLVPGERVDVPLCDRVYTHFERSEDLAELGGKLDDDLLRLRHILDEATGRSVIILNEIFTSTTFRDAYVLGRETLRRISDLDALCACVTFADELSALSQKTVSYVAEVEPSDPSVRTFVLHKRPADGKAYATVVADRHGLTYQKIVERLT